MPHVLFENCYYYKHSSDSLKMKCRSNCIEFLAKLFFEWRCLCNEKSLERNLMVVNIVYCYVNEIIDNINSILLVAEWLAH